MLLAAGAINDPFFFVILSAMPALLEKVEIMLLALLGRAEVARADVRQQFAWEIGFPEGSIARGTARICHI